MTHPTFETTPRGLLTPLGVEQLQAHLEALAAQDSSATEAQR